MDLTKINQVLDTCLIAGKIMVESGSEMYRVEDTMKRIASNAGVGESIVYSTSTGIFIGLANQPFVHLGSVDRRTINLEKVQRVNTASRSFAQGDLTLEELNRLLTDIQKNTPHFPLWWEVIGAAFVSAFLMVMLTGRYDWIDMFPSALMGAIGYFVFVWFNNRTSIRFIGEFMGSFIIGLGALIIVTLLPSFNMDNIIIGAVMPLVPGVAITNAIRDMLMGHLLSGISRGMEAIFSAFAIGTGIALIFRFFI